MNAGDGGPRCPGDDDAAREAAQGPLPAAPAGVGSVSAAAETAVERAAPAVERAGDPTVERAGDPTERAIQYPAALLHGAGHFLVYGNPPFRALFGVGCFGLPAAEALLDLPRAAFELMDLVYREGRPLARWITLRDATWRLTVAERRDIGTGEVYGIALHLVPRERGDVPRERGDVPRERGDVPRERGDVPRERGDVPRERGDSPG